MKNLTVSILLISSTLFSISCTIDEVEPLTNEEKVDLQFLREEEKLARDVYLFSYEIYKEEIFNKISKSEQTHMDRILDLLNKYNIEDPAVSEIGVFTNEILQTLYNDLTNQSSISLVEALKAGATIEDLDIRDIELNEERTTIDDIENIYEKLKCGSTNHMRAFNQKLIENNLNYTPQYITLDYFNEIINSSNSKCGNQ